MSSAEPPQPEPEAYVHLVEQARGGDRSAAAALCLRFAPAVRSFARRRLRNREATGEFTQDVMLLLVEALLQGAVEEPSRLPGFVLGICRNLARDRVRQRERRDALWAAYGADLAEVTPAPERLTYELIHLEDCLSSISKRAREVVRLSFIEAASPKDIAEQLSISETNARVLRHRTLQSLRQCMSKRISWEAA